MTANRISIENAYSHITFIPTPKQVKRAADLPNWFLTLADKETNKAVKVYLQIQQTDPVGPLSIQDAMVAVEHVKSRLKDPEFIEQFGELILNSWMQRAPTESETYRVGKELYNFFKRRGRDTRTSIGVSTSKKFNPIVLGLESDLLFTTYRSHVCFKRNYKSISGTVLILGQTHHFELSHPLFDMSMIMTAGDARKTIISGLRKAFPFITGDNSIGGWTFDNQVQGK